MNNDNSIVGMPPLELSTSQRWKLLRWSTNGYIQDWDLSYEYHDGMAPAMLIDCEMELSDIRKDNRPGKGGTGGPIDVRGIARDFFDRYGVGGLPEWTL